MQLKRLQSQHQYSLLSYDQSLKGGGFWDDVNGGFLLEDLVLTARREEIEWVHADGVYESVPMHECVKMQARKLLELIWVDTDKSVDPAQKKIRSRLCAGEYQTKKQRALLVCELFSAIPPLEAVKALVSIMMSANWTSKGELMKLRHHDISRAHFQGTAQRLIYIRLPAEERQKCGEDKVGRLIKSMYGTQDASHIWQLDRCDPDLWRVGRIPKRQTKCRSVPQSKWRRGDSSTR